MSVGGTRYTLHTHNPYHAYSHTHSHLPAVPPSHKTFPPLISLSTHVGLPRRDRFLIVGMSANCDEETKQEVTPTQRTSLSLALSLVVQSHTIKHTLCHIHYNNNRHLIISSFILYFIVSHLSHRQCKLEWIISRENRSITWTLKPS